MDPNPYLCSAQTSWVLDQTFWWVLSMAAWSPGQCLILCACWDEPAWTLQQSTMKVYYFCLSLFCIFACHRLANECLVAIAPARQKTIGWHVVAHESVRLSVCLGFWLRLVPLSGTAFQQFLQFLFLCSNEVLTQVSQPRFEFNWICFSEQILPQHFIHQPRPSHFDFGGKFKHGLAGLHRILDLCFLGGKPQTQSHSSSSEIRVLQECHYSGSCFEKGGTWTDLKYDFSRGYVRLISEDGAEHHAKGLSHFAKGPYNGPLNLPIQADGADESPDSREPPCTVKEPPEKRRKIIQELETVRNCLADAYEALGRLTALLDAVVDWSKCGPGKKAVLQSAPWKLYVHARV